MGKEQEVLVEGGKHGGKRGSRESKWTDRKGRTHMTTGETALTDGKITAACVNEQYSV